MEERQGKKRQEGRQSKFDDARRFGEERMQLLDTIHEMIDIEFERRGFKPENNSLAGISPKENTWRESPGLKPHRCSLWQRIMKLLFVCR